MQSGLDQTQYWRIDFDNLGGGNRWENPLMGWASRQYLVRALTEVSGDAVQALNLKFRTKDEAVYFAEKQGWGYAVSEPHQPKFRKKQYGDNFKYSAAELRFIKTK
jgi:NADH dehydrogenase (ubiquinone) Fe-S protein 4